MREGSFGISAVLILSWAGLVSAQPTIDHERVRCVPRESFAQYIAQIAPPDTIRSARLYFRSASYNDFYFVDMTPGPQGFGGTLPLPSPETSGIVYYIEAVDASFQTTRSEEFRVDVGDNGCGPGPGALLYAGAPPGIVVGATNASMAALPVGFQATGITGFISAAGVAGTAAGSGIGVGVAVGAAAGAAAGVGVIVATSGEEPSGGPAEMPMTSGGPPGPSEPGPTPPGPSPMPPGPPDPGPTNPTPPSPNPPEPPGPPGPTPPEPPGPTEPPEPPEPPEPTPTGPPTACFNWSAVKGTCQVHFDASCSDAPAGGARYEWLMLGPPTIASPPEESSFTFDFTGDPRCVGQMAFNRPVRLTVTDSENRSDSEQQNVSVEPAASFGPREPRTLTLTFTSRLLSPAGEIVEGWVSVDGVALGSSSSAAPTELRIGSASESVRVEATAISAVPEGTLWELDFTASGAGSFAIERGTAVVNDSHRVVFRLSGVTGEVLRFRRISASP